MHFELWRIENITLNRTAAITRVLAFFSLSLYIFSFLWILFQFSKFVCTRPNCGKAQKRTLNTHSNEWFEYFSTFCARAHTHTPHTIHTALQFNLMMMTTIIVCHTLCDAGEENPHRNEQTKGYEMTVAFFAPVRCAMCAMRCFVSDWLQAVGIA